ncbi:hypothetical protein ACIBF1_44355 [Spirillospora sp. NPDC050679]
MLNIKTLPDIAVLPYAISLPSPASSGFSALLKEFPLTLPVFIGFSLLLLPTVGSSR